MAEDETVEFTEFCERLAGAGVDLLPWQRRLAEAAMRGERVSFAHARRSGREAFTVVAGAMCELRGERWDVIGSPEYARRVRREAREWAARIAEWEQPPSKGKGY